MEIAAAGTHIHWATYAGKTMLANVSSILPP
jgi:hypothetical protein